MTASQYRLTLCLVLACLCTSTGSCRRAQEGLSPGDTAPAFSALDLQKISHSISDFRGKVVLLNFWATWCTPCLDEIASIEELSRKLGPLGFTVVAVAVHDDPQAVKTLIEQKKLSFNVLLDPEGIAAKRYEVRGYPESFVIDRAGKVAMVPDPSTGKMVVRMIGPKSFEAPNFRQALEGLLQPSG